VLPLAAIIVRSFALTQYRRVIKRQTDVQTNRNAIANTTCTTLKCIVKYVTRTTFVITPK